MDTTLNRFLHRRGLPAVCVCLFSLVALGGCGGDGRPSLVQVKGKVTVDGEPIEGAQVALQRIQEDENAEYQRPSRAITDAQGEFVPSTYGHGDGLPVGKYRVGVIKREMVGEPPKDFNPETPDLYNLRYKWHTPREYADPTTSGLEIEVTADGIQPEVIELKTNGRPPEIEITGPQGGGNVP